MTQATLNAINEKIMDENTTPLEREQLELFLLLQKSKLLRDLAATYKPEQIEK